MNVATLIQDINDEIEDRICCINEGGCCVYAAELGKRLRQLGYKVRGVAMSRWDKPGNISKARAAISEDKLAWSTEWKKHDVPFYHIALEYYDGGVWWLVDAERKPQLTKGNNFKQHGYRLAPGRFTVEEMDLLAHKASNWNNTFDRKQIPLLRDIMDNHFSIIDYQEAA